MKNALNVINVEIPALSQRQEDIPGLVDYFIARFKEQNSSPVKSISAGAMSALLRYHWPGNLRELSSYIERMMVLADNPQIELDNLPPFFQGNIYRAPQTTRAVTATEKAADFDKALGTMKLADLENRAIASTLQRLHNNRTRAADSLGISVRTLQRKLGVKDDDAE